MIFKLNVISKVINEFQIRSSLRKIILIEILVKNVFVLFDFVILLVIFLFVFLSLNLFNVEIDDDLEFINVVYNNIEEVCIY